MFKSLHGTITKMDRRRHTFRVALDLLHLAHGGFLEVFIMRFGEAITGLAEYIQNAAGRPDGVIVVNNVQVFAAKLLLEDSPGFGKHTRTDFHAGDMNLM